MTDYKEQARFFHILSHPARLQILDILRKGDECVCHIQSVLGKRQAYVSQQLMILRDAGLVSDRKDGLNVFYRLSEPAVAEVLQVLIGPTAQRAECDQAACPHCQSSDQTLSEPSIRPESVS